MLKLQESIIFCFLNCEYELTINFHINFIITSSVWTTMLYVKFVIIKSVITDVHTVDGEFSSSNVQYSFTGCVTWTGSRAELIVIQWHSPIY